MIGQGSAAQLLNKWRRPGERRRFLTPAALAIALIGAVAVYISLLISPGMTGVLGAALAVIVLAIAVIDLRSFIIPNWLNAAGGILALVYAAVQEPSAMLDAILAATVRGIVLAVIFLGLRYGYARYRGRQGLGLGDVKLAFVAGAWLDWMIIPLALQVAVLAALMFCMVRHQVSGRPLSKMSRVPFGLFFAPAIWIGWVIEVRFFALF